MRTLLKFNADPNVGCNENDEKPLHYAARGGHAQALTKLFKESKIDAFARNRKGATCLHSAAKKGRIESLQIILKQFRRIQEEMSSTADTQSSRFDDAIDFVDSSGQTALHVAAGAGYEDAVSILVKAGADASLVDNKGRTPKKLPRRKATTTYPKSCEKRKKRAKAEERRWATCKSRPTRLRISKANTRKSRSVQRTKQGRRTRSYSKTRRG